MQILPPCSGKLLQERLRLSWRGCVCADSSARVWGWERSWKGPRSGSGVWLVLGVTGLAAQGCETSQPWPGQAGGISHHPGTAISPCPAIPTSLLSLGVPRAGSSSGCLLLLPRFAAHIKPNMFSKAFQFLMKTSAFLISLASARQDFGGCWAQRWSLVLSALAGQGRLFGHCGGSWHIPIPGSTAQCQLCQLCQPRPQHQP